MSERNYHFLYTIIGQHLLINGLNIYYMIGPRGNRSEHQAKAGSYVVYLGTVETYVYPAWIPP